MSSLQQSGKISLIEVANEFGVTSGPRSLLSFYRGGGNVSATDLITSSATSAPSNNTPVSDFAGTTGLTLTSELTTLTVNSSGHAKIFNKPHNNTNDFSAERTEALNGTYSYEANDIIEVKVRNDVIVSTDTIAGTWTSGTVNFSSPITLQNDMQNMVLNDTNWSVSARGYSGSDTRETSFFTVYTTGAGVLDITSISTRITNPGSNGNQNRYHQGLVRVKPGTDNQAVTVRRDGGTTFANSNSYAVTIAGLTTETVQGGQSLTGIFPDSSNNYVVSFTPTTNNQTSTITPPTNDSAVSDFGGVTGLTCTRTTTTSTSTSVGGFVQVGSTVVGSSGTILSPPYVSNAQGNPTRLARVRNQSTGAQPVIERVESKFGSNPQLSGDESNNANISSGSVSSSREVPGNSILFFKVRFSGAGGPSDQRVSTEVQSLVTTTTNTFTYSFTNNTGHDVTISGSGITTTTLTNGSSTSTDIAHPSGNFTIQHVVDNPLAVNGNIPSAGRISLTNFYGTNG